ncbi:MAG: amino acid ABC transporter substrate-binding protein, partial [Nitratireductor sp.]
GEPPLQGMVATRPGSSETDGTSVFNKLAEEAGVPPTGTFVPQGYDAAFLIALAIEKNGNGGREGLSKALREVASAPGEVILPGEWEKAKKLLAEGADINYEGASGSHEFDDNGDVPGVIVKTVVDGVVFKEVGQVD